MKPYPLIGGLDLRSGTLAVNPGTLSDCLNYEVSTVDGYSRIAGLERFDGQFRIAEYTTLRLFGSWTGAFLPGDLVTVGTVQAYVTRAVLGVIDVIQAGRDPYPTIFPVTVTNTSRTGAQTVAAVTVLAKPTGTQAVVNTARKALSAPLRALVQPVPGNPDMPVAGLFWFKNRLYAIRDFPRIWFQADSDLPFSVNDVVTLPGGSYVVMAAVYTSGSKRSGSLTLWPLRDDGTAMKVLPKPGDTVSRIGTIGASFELGGAPFATAPLALFDAGSATTISATVTAAQESAPTSGDEPIMRRAGGSAGLWKATGNGWQAVDLKREVQFSDGQAAFGTFITAHIGPSATPTTSPVTFPTAATMNGADCTAALAADDATTVALSGAASDNVLASDFNFSAIPDSATILGVEVRIKRNATTGAECADGVVELTGLDGASANKASVVAWDTTPAEAIYGGPTDTWGNDNLTPAIVKSAAFGVHLATQAIDTTPAGGIDSIKVLVTYRRRDATVWVDRGASRQAISLIDVQLVDGDWTTNDGSGYLVIDPANSGFAATFAPGMKVYDAATAGNLLATLASIDTRILLPGWDDLQANQSQYRCLATNFYGMSDYRAIYGVSGASLAFVYDGTHLAWIHTPMDANVDLPRHVARHGSSLVLGYYQGAYIVSVVGQPTNFRGRDGAASFEIGERLTGIMNAMGDALLVTGAGSTRVLHGLDPATYQQDTVSGNRGALEYTMADAGRLLALDQIGIAAVDATQAFGALTRTYVSMAVEDWLKSRLRGNSGAAMRNIRPLCAVALRYQNQYRVYFQDGYVLTLTIGKPLQFTLQRYFLPGDATTPDQPFPLASLASGIDADGTGRLFGSFDADANRGYVFELDHGATFDGQKVPAMLVLNPLSFSVAVMLKRFEHMFLLGRAEGYAQLLIDHAVNGDIPDGVDALPMTLGDEEADYGTRQARGSLDSPVEGYDVTIRIDSLTDEEGVHTLQAIATDADPRGDSRGHVRG